ncbi:glutathione S-transferase family protein [Bordetella hinzii]|uniref:Glutathione S-transferase family protein n=1 Tax=Bordetella hinzii TaxID=103855 RepID=A0AAN1RT88_9BORD|nr:glutathione S-transferase family protein [Bordetella hinzii]AKQ59350.1 Disulfide-bond oxidoreductase YfcG [Bordetella hinzii]AZW15410.1 glutathione S-transferase family protein [Bordetella hinzii]MBZ0073951.1 glutathione S-transferase family protein [Bordetella hinzii]MBZ0077573.1 glutathione S-transferase family protein [Bordetella hinzii]MBZ0082748.1 glutathione S-transferase family protein [Bordetella hinzii]
MLTLYHAPQSRSFRTLWLLEELGVSYAIQNVAIRRRGQGEPPPDSYRQIHPHGKVPALVHDGVPVFETPAIALYLTDLFPDRGLGPLAGDPLRGPYLSWLAYSTGVFEPAIADSVRKIENEPGPFGWASLEEVLTVLSRRLQAHPYLLAEAFSAADVVLGGAMQYLTRVGAMPETEPFSSYIERLADRPALHRALQRDGGPIE